MENANVDYTEVHQCRITVRVIDMGDCLILVRFVQ